MEFAKIVSFLKESDALPVKKFSHRVDYTKSTCEITGHSGIKLHRITMVNEKDKDITCVVNTQVLETFRQLNSRGFLWFDAPEDLEFFAIRTELGNLNAMNYLGSTNSGDDGKPLYNERGLLICNLSPERVEAYNRAVKRLVEDKFNRASKRLRELFPAPYNLTINPLGSRRVLKCEFKDPDGGRKDSYSFILSFEDDTPEFITDVYWPQKFAWEERELNILCTFIALKE